MDCFHNGSLRFYAVRSFFFASVVVLLLFCFRCLFAEVDWNLNTSGIVKIHKKVDVTRFDCSLLVLTLMCYSISQCECEAQCEGGSRLRECFSNGSNTRWITRGTRIIVGMKGSEF